MGNKLATWLLVVVLVTAAWWAALGWDTERNGDGSGPYSTWQVVVFVLVLVALAGWLGLRRTALVGSIVLALAATVNWSISAATATIDGANLWPIGAAGVLIGSLAGSLAVSYLTANLTARR